MYVVYCQLIVFLVVLVITGPWRNQDTDEHNHAAEEDL